VGKWKQVRGPAAAANGGAVVYFSSSTFQYAWLRTSTSSPHFKRVSEGIRTLTSWFTARYAVTPTPRTPSTAARPGIEPYPTPFPGRLVSTQRPEPVRLPSNSVDSPGIEPGLPPCHGGVFPLDHEPVFFFRVDRMGVEPIAPTLQGSVAPNGMSAHFLQRSVRELNPVFRLTTAACGRNTYRPKSSRPESNLRSLGPQPSAIPVASPSPDARRAPRAQVGWEVLEPSSAAFQATAKPSQLPARPPVVIPPPRSAASVVLIPAQQKNPVPCDTGFCAGEFPRPDWRHRRNGCAGRLFAGQLVNR
jgi:hypothetical protein